MVSSKRTSGSLMGAMLRTVTLVGAAAALLLFGGAGWLIAGDIEDEYLVPRVDTPLPASQVATVDGDVVAINLGSPQDRQLMTDGWWAIEWDEGFGLLGGIRNTGVGRVVRSMVPQEGFPPQPDDMVAVHSWAFGSDPLVGLGLVYDDVTIEGPVGSLNAWLVPGRSDTWAVVVHGEHAERREGLRVTSVLSELGLPVLLMDYRNDPNAPTDPSGFRRWGATEWEDLEAAVEFTQSQGAREVVLIGSSMGGSIVMSFLYESELASMAAGAVLDAPHLDPLETVVRSAEADRLPVINLPTPSIVAETAAGIAAWRFGIDWEAIDYVDRAEELEVPVLILHGTNDLVAPLASSIDMALARPDLVKLEQFEGAGHGEAWNVERDRYRVLVRSFVESS